MQENPINQGFRIALVANSSSFSDLPQVLSEIELEYGRIIEVHTLPIHKIEEEMLDEEAVLSVLASCHAILCDIRSNSKALRLVQDTWKAHDNTIVPLMGGSPEVMALARMGPFSMKRLAERQTQVELDYRRIKQLTNVVEKLGAFLPVGSLRHARNWVRAIKYWTNSGKDNLKNLLLLTAREYGGLKVRVLPPQEFPEDGIYCPGIDRRFRRLGDYLKARPLDPSLPTVGILYYGGMHFEPSVAGTGALIAELAGRANVIPVFTAGMLNLQAVEKYFAVKGKPVIDALVSLIWFRLNGGPMGGDPSRTLDLLQRLDVPLFAPVCMFQREVDRWESSAMGISPVEVLAAVTFPELDGAIEPIPLLGLEGSTGGGGDSGRARPIVDRSHRIAERVLRRTGLTGDNRNKRIAIIVYSYPPGEANLAGAAYLDVFESLQTILAALKQDGYTVETPEGPLRDEFLGRGIVNSAEWSSQEKMTQACPRLNLESYLGWFNTLPVEAQEEITACWGNPPGSIMTSGSEILIPGLLLGNVFVGLQPSRGVHEDPSKAYHDKALPPHHQYVAFYRFLAEHFRADAIIHLGTHGTLEFLPGKEIGLSQRCFPDILIDNVPHIYVYHVTNPSEALIAKRRGYAQIVNHAPPAFARSGLYGDYLHLEDLVTEYQGQKLLNDSKAAGTHHTIREEAEKLGLTFDSVEELHNELSDLKRSIIPSGLHVFGKPLERKRLVDFLTLVCRYDRGSVKSLHRLIAEAEGQNYEEVLETPETLEKIETSATEIIDRIMQGDRRNPLGKPFDEEFDRLADYVLQTAERVNQSEELSSLLRALSGGYVLPNLAGDPIRTPQVFPTGCNSYQFDPRQIPTEAASARGAWIADETLRLFHLKHGRYPETVGVVLWGFETAKTFGETVAQVLSYLGLRAVHGKGWYPSLEVIPIEKLGRPRIDVNVNICGFFRDLFPNLVKTLDEGLAMVAGVDEDNGENYVKKHAKDMFDNLVVQGTPSAEARRISSARLFGPRAGEYGTNLPQLVETSNWEKEADLADSYMHRMDYVYGDNIHARQSAELQKYLLSRTEIVSQIRDTHEYEITDLDHYYEFFGGLSKSVEQISGQMPEMVIADTTKERTQVKGVSETIKHGLISRLLNPRWIDALLAHEFHGAQKIADRVQYVLGLAATTGAVDDWTWSSIASRYVFDEEMLRRLLQNNAFATAEIARRLMEASQRGYWDATEEEKERMKAVYLEIERAIEERI